MRNKAVAFLSRDEAPEIRRSLLERFGEPEVVRDLGLLESELYRPQTGYYDDLAEMAAALFESPIMNHPSGRPPGVQRAARFCPACAGIT